MPKRMYPQDYFTEQIEQPKKLETDSVIPIWVPVLLAIALVGAFAVALYALSLNKKERIVYKEQHGAKSDT
jgi:hypothetical protein